MTAEETAGGATEETPAEAPSPEPAAPQAGQTISQVVVTAPGREASEGNGMAVAGLVLSLCAYPLFWMVVPWILGIIFSAIGLARSGKLPGRRGRGLAIGGLAAALGPILIFFALGFAGLFA